MANFEDIAKKAFYMGVGFASYAQEKASDNMQDLKEQAQKLAEEMAERGKMSTEEARKFVDELVEQAQQENVSGNNGDREPRRIEIVDDDSSVRPTPTPDREPGDRAANAEPYPDDLKEQVRSLEEELRRLKNEM